MIKPKLVMSQLGGQKGEVRRKCEECGRTMTGTRQEYHYTECGLSFVTLRNVLVFECECGLRVPEIASIARLHVMIALALLRKRTPLAGEEVRFLRKVAGLSQEELARIMGVHPTRPSKWESKGITQESDRLLRVFCLLGLGQQLTGGTNKEELNAFAANNLVRNLDVRELLINIKQKKAGPLRVAVENDPTNGLSGPWVLPEFKKKEGATSTMMQ